MTIKWYVVKYVPDVFKNEPRNIGVVVADESCGVARFLGETAKGVDNRTARRVVASTETYTAWREYLRYHLDSGTLGRAMESLRLRSNDTYRLEERGTVRAPLDAGLEGIADELFVELVAGPESTQRSLKKVANQILFEKLRVPHGHEIERDVPFDIELRGEQHRFRFDYRYVNGHVSLMERLSLAGHEGNVTTRVNDTLFRIENVAETLKMPTFLVLYDLGRDGLTEKSTQQLHVLEKFAHTIDVRSRNAAVRVGEALELEVA